MNRFKFRAWLPDEETMLYSDRQLEEDDLMEVWQIGESITVEIQEIYWHSPGGNEPEEACRYITPNQIVMQFTGKQDKNSKDIFEGDIIPLDFTIDTVNAHYIKGPGIINGYVEWSNSRYIIKYPESKRYNVVSTEFGWGGQNHLEVIGNMYQNPELLKNN